MEELLRRLVDQLSQEIGRPVLIDDPDLHPLAYSSQEGDVDGVRRSSILARTAPPEVKRALFEAGIRTARGPFRIPARDDIGMEARLCVPLAVASKALGYLWLIDNPPLEKRQVDAARAAAREAVRILSPEAALLQARRAREQSLLEAILAGQGGPSEEEMRMMERDGLLESRPLIVAVASLSGGGGEDALDWLHAGIERFRRRIGQGGMIWGVHSGWPTLIASLYLLPSADPCEIARSLCEAIRSEPPAKSAELRVGVGTPFDDFDEARASHRRARVAMRAADRESPGLGWRELKADRLIGLIPATAEDDLPEGLKRLLTGENAALRQTLRTYLDNAGDVKKTARDLNLHRGTLYYRLKRIAEITELDLGDGDDRLLAHLALRLFG